MTASSDISRRFKVTSRTAPEIRTAVHDRLDESQQAAILDVDLTWSLDTLPLSEILLVDDLAPKRSAAQSERHGAIARTKLAFGEADPFIVIFEENALLDGYARYETLDELGADDAVVFRGLPH